MNPIEVAMMIIFSIVVGIAFYYVKAYYNLKSKYKYLREITDYWRNKAKGVDDNAENQQEAFGEKNPSDE